MLAMDAVRLRINQLPEDRGLTVTGLASLCGMTQSSIENITNSRYKSANIATIKKICDGLEIELDDFFCEELFEDIEPVGVKKKENNEGLLDNNVVTMVK